MLHIGSRLKYLLELQKVNLVQLAKDVNISRATLYNYFEMEEIPRKKLHAVCDAAGIDIDQVYHEHLLNDPAAEYKKLQDKVKSLEDQIKQKDVIIIQQSEMIELLKKSKRK